jgi:hypothetical protein
MRKGEEGCSIETAMYSVYILNQERNHVTKSHVKIQFTVYRVNSGARLTIVMLVFHIHASINGVLASKKSR